MRLDETMKTKTNTMKPTYTPGPWTVRLDREGDYQVRGSNGYLVMQISSGTIPDNADVRLISCAPEMLEVLVRLLLEVESICAHGAGETRDELLERLHRDWDGRLRAARMVITKAKGGEA